MHCSIDINTPIGGKNIIINKMHSFLYINLYVLLTSLLGGPCKAGKSTLASVLIDEEIPLQWNSTDGLIIFFGRNGIDIENRKMVPLKEG